MLLSDLEAAGMANCRWRPCHEREGGGAAPDGLPARRAGSGVGKMGFQLIHRKSRSGCGSVT